jgi:hypothetical protein
MSDDCNQTLLDKSLDVVQEDILYVKIHKVRETIQFVTYTVMSDDCIGEKLNYLPYLVTFYI